LGHNFFLWDNNFMSHFSGHFEGASTFLTPKLSRSFSNCGTLIVIISFSDQKLQFTYSMSKLQEKPSALKREHPESNEIYRFFLCSFLPSWILIRIANPVTDPGTPLNPDPVRIRIHSTGCI
jgi:hypothetical protein